MHVFGTQIGWFTLDFKYIISALGNQVELRPTSEINRSHAKIACHLKNNLSIIFSVIYFLLEFNASKRGTWTEFA